MERIGAADGTTLLCMLESAGGRLASDAGALDALNVFPVPDGDTGTNLLHTVRAALVAAAALAASPASPPPTASAMSAAMAKGALEGARGNSGIILSQFFRGLAAALDGKDVCAPTDFADAFVRAQSFARAGISNPTEGTILTVLGDVARALAGTRPDDTAALCSVVQTAVAAAAASVERTPTLLEVLRTAGVVDAGARGMLLVLEGFLEALGDGVASLSRPATVAASRSPASAPRRRARPAGSWGFCTEFLLSGTAIPLDQLRAKLEREGTSVILVGDARTARIHLHTPRPDAVVAYARSIGTVSRLETQDLDRQCEDAAVVGAPAAAVRNAVVSLVDGEGFAELCRSMGADAVRGDFHQSLDGVAAGDVILVAGSDAALAAARRLRPPAGVTVRIVPARSGPACIAALLAYRFDADASTNAAAMSCAASGVRTLEVSSGSTEPLAELRTLLRGAAAQGPVDAVTVYRGAGAGEPLGAQAADVCRAAFPGADVQVAYGGQPGPLMVVSLE